MYFGRLGRRNQDSGDFSCFAKPAVFITIILILIKKKKKKQTRKKLSAQKQLDGLLSETRLEVVGAPLSTLHLMYRGVADESLSL